MYIPKHKNLITVIKCCTLVSLFLSVSVSTALGAIDRPSDSIGNITYSFNDSTTVYLVSDTPGVKTAGNLYNDSTGFVVFRYDVDSPVSIGTLSVGNYTLYDMSNFPSADCTGLSSTDCINNGYYSGWHSHITITATPPPLYNSFVDVPLGLVASLSVASGGVFADMLPVAVIVIGIAIGLLVLSWSIQQFRRKR